MEFAFLPLWYQYTMVFVLGLIIGSFLNVVIYRLHTGRSLSGHSHCMSCGKNLHWYELVPLFSYIVQRGRCRGCSSYVPIRYLLCEFLTAIAFLLLFIRMADPVLLILVLVLMSVLIVIFFYDIYHYIIPDRLVILVGIVSIIHVLYLTPMVSALIMSLLGGLGAFAFLGGLWWYSKGRWIGLGDAKLAFPLALILGPLATFSFVVLSFWIGSLVGLGLLLLARMAKRGQPSLLFLQNRFTIKSEVPFAPFLIVSFWLVYLYQIHVLSVLESLFMFLWL